jgi:predicted acyltransferase (DUF342 family)
MYANPVSVSPGTSATQPPDYGKPRRSTLVIEDGDSVNDDIIAANDVILGKGAVVTGTISCGGNLVVGPGARIGGSLIARGHIWLGSRATVHGHVFSDRTIVVSAGSTIGTADTPKTMEGADSVSLAPGVTIFGWVICEHGGMTVGAEA